MRYREKYCRLTFSFDVRSTSPFFRNEISHSWCEMETKLQERIWKPTCSWFDIHSLEKVFMFLPHFPVDIGYIVNPMYTNSISFSLSLSRPFCYFSGVKKKAFKEKSLTLSRLVAKEINIIVRTRCLFLFQIFILEHGNAFFSNPSTVIVFSLLFCPSLLTLFQCLSNWNVSLLEHRDFQ